MKVISNSFKRLKIKVVKTKMNKKTKEITVLFKVDCCDKVHERVLYDLGYGDFGMNYNGEYLTVKTK